MRVVLFGPSHFVGFDGLAASSDWQTPLGTVPVDCAMVERLIKAKLIGVLDAAHAQEHSLEVHYHSCKWCSMNLPWSRSSPAMLRRKRL